MTPRRPAGDLEPTEAESRRAARERALELLYEAEAKGATVAEVLDGLPLTPDALAAFQAAPAEEAGVEAAQEIVLDQRVEEAGLLHQRVGQLQPHVQVAGGLGHALEHRVDAQLRVAVATEAVRLLRAHGVEGPVPQRRRLPVSGPGGVVVSVVELDAIVAGRRRPDKAALLH